MSTIIYPSPIFGPVRSRRLGISLGINLMPPDGKICSFDCIYCECGLNAERRPHSTRPTHHEVFQALESSLQDMETKGELPDVITFAGNGEPTAHPDFLLIMADTLALRNLYAPKAKVSVLTNGTFIDRPEVFRALLLADNNIVKLDTVDDVYIGHVNQPVCTYSASRQVELLQRFHGHVIIQTMFLHGTVNSNDVSNTSDTFVEPWLAALQQIQPQQVMIYTVARETPLPSLSKASREELDAICRRVEALGVPASVSY